MTARFTADPPLASTDTWAGRDPPLASTGTRFVKTRYVSGKWRPEPFDPPLDQTDAIGAGLEAIWRENMARRDAAAAAYGEPETPHEFYAGRPGSKAETIVLDCLRELRDIPEADRLYAHELTDAICAIYLDLAWRAPPQRDDAAKIRRRTTALWELFRTGMEEKA